MSSTPTTIKNHLGFVYRMILESYRSIHGDSSEEKLKTVGLKTIQTAAWITAAYVLYPLLITIVESQSLLVSLGFSLLSCLPYLGQLSRGFFLLRCQSRFVDTINALKGPVSISQRFISIAILYALAHAIFRSISALSHLSVEDQQHKPQKIFCVYAHPALSPISQLLDDCGLTYGDYADLDYFFSHAPDAPGPLKERVASYLYTIGLQSRADFVKQGIISSGSSGQHIMQNLFKHFEKTLVSPVNETNFSLPTIQKTQRIAVAAFNLLLTVGTLALQLKYSLEATLLGLALGLLTQDISMIAIFREDLQSLPKKVAEAAKNMNLEKKQAKHLKKLPWMAAKIVDIFMIDFRKEKTALFSPTTTGHKCRQIWESWKLIAYSITFPASLPVTIAGVAQGQTLASYWQSFCERKALLSPTETRPQLASIR